MKDRKETGDNYTPIHRKHTEWSDDLEKLYEVNQWWNKYKPWIYGDK